MHLYTRSHYTCALWQEIADLRVEGYSKTFIICCTSTSCADSHERDLQVQCSKFVANPGLILDLLANGRLECAYAVSGAPYTIYQPIESVHHVLHMGELTPPSPLSNLSGPGLILRHMHQTKRLIHIIYIIHNIIYCHYVACANDRIRGHA